MTMTRWNPVAELEQMRRQMDALLEKSTELIQPRELAEPPWQPAAEIFENATELVIELDLPGLVQEEIQVRIEEHTLMIQGERKANADETMLTQRNDRNYGTFYREFALPGDFDEARTEASCEHGVLQVRLQKKTAGSARRIDVEVR